MYGVYKPLRKESILEYVSEWEIFKRYIRGLAEPNCSFVSELREESNASCRVTLLNGRYRYKDFGEEGTSQDCFSYVQKKYTENYNDALKRIVHDFNLIDVIDVSGGMYHEVRPILINGRENNTRKKPTILNIVERNWQILDKMFWSDRYGITQLYLDAINVRPITQFTIINDKFPTGLTIDTSLHCYSFEYYMNGVFRRKIYQPYSVRRKWTSNVDNTIVQGIKILPKEGGELLFITSSLKDAGAITCNTGIYAIAPNNETSFIPAKVFEKLRSKWRHIILWFDNDYTKPDNPGLKFSRSISEKYGLSYVLTPDGSQKDPSDYIHNFGRNSFMELVRKLLRQQNINYGIYDFNQFRQSV